MRLHGLLYVLRTKLMAWQSVSQSLYEYSPLLVRVVDSTRGCLCSRPLTLIAGVCHPACFVANNYLILTLMHSSPAPAQSSICLDCACVWPRCHFRSICLSTTARAPAFKSLAKRQPFCFTLYLPRLMHAQTVSVTVCTIFRQYHDPVTWLFRDLFCSIRRVLTLSQKHVSRDT